MLFEMGEVDAALAQFVMAAHLEPTNIEVIMKVKQLWNIRKSFYQRNLDKECSYYAVANRRHQE